MNKGKSTILITKDVNGNEISKRRLHYKTATLIHFKTGEEMVFDLRTLLKKGQILTVQHHNRLVAKTIPITNDRGRLLTQTRVILSIPIGKYGQKDLNFVVNSPKKADVLKEVVKTAKADYVYQALLKNKTANTPKKKVAVQVELIDETTGERKVA